MAPRAALARVLAALALLAVALARSQPQPFSLSLVASDTLGEEVRPQKGPV